MFRSSSTAVGSGNFRGGHRRRRFRSDRRSRPRHRGRTGAGPQIRRVQKRRRTSTASSSLSSTSRTMGSSINMGRSLFSRHGFGQFDPEPAALPERSIPPRPARPCVRCLFAPGPRPAPVPGYFPRSRRIKKAEDLLLIVGRDAQAVVLHPNPDRLGLLFRPQAHQRAPPPAGQISKALLVRWESIWMNVGSCALTLRPQPGAFHAGVSCFPISFCMRDSTGSNNLFQAHRRQLDVLLAGAGSVGEQVAQQGIHELRRLVDPGGHNPGRFHSGPCWLHRPAMRKSPAWIAAARAVVRHRIDNRLQLLVAGGQFRGAPGHQPFELAWRVPPDGFAPRASPLPLSRAR